MHQSPIRCRAIKGVLAGTLMLFGMLHPGFAQKSLKFSGLSYVDYAYTLASPTAGEAGENGFILRRLFLTADYTLSSKFSGRVRAEANDGSVNTTGRPVPFVKDMYLKVHDFLGQGHDLQIGLYKPPVFDEAEKFWGYRSLEKTVLDLFKIVASRDFGVMIRGPLGGGETWRYSVMMGNNESGRPEGNRFKRLYGQVAWMPSKTVVATVATDYAGYADGRRGTNFSGFLGYRATAFRVGLEGFYNRFTQASMEVEQRRGQSAFAIFTLSDQWHLMARADWVTRTLPNTDDVKETFLLIGVEHQPHEKVSFMPNLIVRDSNQATAEIIGRMTLYIQF